MTCVPRGDPVEFADRPKPNLMHGGEDAPSEPRYGIVAIGGRDKVPNSIALQRLVEDGPGFRFRGLAGTQQIEVQLDTSAVLKLAGMRMGSDVRPAVVAAHARIEAAASRLFDAGHAAAQDGSPLERDQVAIILVSAIDLD